MSDAQYLFIWRIQVRSATRDHDVLDTCLDDGYRAMAEDTARESEAHEWCNALAKDMHSETR